VVGHFQKHTLSNVLVTLSSGADEYHSGCGQDLFIGEKILSCSFCLYRFRKYVSYGFPIINLCNPEVHYEKNCVRISVGKTLRRLGFTGATKTPDIQY
jgi:hypothetical protein